MSIYGSWKEIGEDDWGDLDGTVLTYHRSHVFPSVDHPRAALGLADIPGHCVPGQSEDDFTHVARFLRLDVREAGEMITSTVILTEPAAEELRAQLAAWLAIPKLDPAYPEGAQS